MSWWIPLLPKKQEVCNHQVEKIDELEVVFKKIPCENMAAYDIYELKYKQSQCLKCGKKFRYDLAEENYFHTINFDGTKIFKRF